MALSEAKPYIGAGFGRTGTRSLKKALEILGHGPSYHMVERLSQPRNIVHWEKAEQNQPVDWNACFKGFQAVFDFPGYRHYQALMAQYLQANVILTERDPNDSWESVLTTIYRAEPGFRQKMLMSFRLPCSVKLRQQIRCFQLTKQV